MCPGRHFATIEILAFFAAMVLQFDVTPASDVWVQPTTNKVEFWETTPSPDEDSKVNIRSVQRREFDEQVAFTLTGSDDPIELTTEDLVS